MMTWLYGLCCDGKRDRVLYCNRNLYFGCLAKLASSFFFFISISLYYTTVLVAFNASIDAVLLHQKLMENCPSFRSGLPSCPNS